MKVKVGIMEPIELSKKEIDELAFIAWHVAYPGPYDGKPSDEELKTRARRVLTR